MHSERTPLLVNISHWHASFLFQLMAYIDSSYYTKKQTLSTLASNWMLQWAWETFIPGYLGVSSPLRPLTCDDTPQVAIRSAPGAVMGRLTSAHFDILEPCVSRPSSRPLTLYFSFQSCCQNIVFFVWCDHNICNCVSLFWLEEFLMSLVGARLTNSSLCLSIECCSSSWGTTSPWPQLYLLKLWRGSKLQTHMWILRIYNSSEFSI